MENSLTVNALIDLNKKKFELLKKNRKPKIGWISIYTPEEIITAAGLIPYRIFGKTEPVKAGRYLHRNICPYVLSCFEEALIDELDFLDGVIIANACDARRKLYDVWKYFLKTDYVHMLDIPKTINPHAIDYFKGQFYQLIKSLEQKYNKKITDDSIKNAISLCNEKRQLLQQLYELRKQDNPLITGTQAVNIVKAGMIGLNDEFNNRLTNLLDELHSQKTSNSKNNKPRILVSGSYFDHIDILDILENAGADVVCEDISNGINYFMGHVDINNNSVVGALADYYLDKATCARMVDSEKRFNHICNLIAEYRVDAVVYFSLKFCDNNLIDFSYQKKKLNEKGIPLLFLETERATTNINQIKIRLQAFLETI